MLPVRRPLSTPTAAASGDAVAVGYEETFLSSIGGIAGPEGPPGRLHPTIRRISQSIGAARNRMVTRRKARSARSSGGDGRKSYVDRESVIGRLLVLGRIEGDRGRRQRGHHLLPAAQARRTLMPPSFRTLTKNRHDRRKKWAPAFLISPTRQPYLLRDAKRSTVLRGTPLVQETNRSIRKKEKSS